MKENKFNDNSSSTSLRLKNRGGSETIVKESRDEQSFTANIEREEKIADCDMREGHVLLREKALLAGFVCVVVGGIIAVCVIPRIASLSNLSWICSVVLALCPAFIGAMFIASGLTTYRDKWRRENLPPGMATWEAEFGKHYRYAANQSVSAARRYVSNFLQAHVVFLPGLYLGWHYLQTNPSNASSVMFLFGLGVLLYVVTAVLTVRKLLPLLPARKICVDVDGFPLFLGQKAKVVVKRRNSHSHMHLRRATLLCVKENVVETKTKHHHNERHILQRVPVQQYAERRRFAVDGIQKEDVELVYDLPDRAELSSSLLSDTPVYWLLKLAGTVDSTPFETAFLLPIVGPYVKSC